MEIKHAYETIVIGGGAVGLFFGAAAPSGRDILILEKTKQTGTKLLMSGSGQCNLTHCGSIKEFLLCYGKNGNKIRTCLYRHSNLALCRFMEGLGISLIEREDGKIFPRSMDAREVRGALLHACAIMSNLSLMSYFAVLFFSGLISGILIGILAYSIEKRLPADFR